MIDGTIFVFVKFRIQTYLCGSGSSILLWMLIRIQGIFFYLSAQTNFFSSSFIEFHYFFLTINSCRTTNRGFIFRKVYTTIAEHEKDPYGSLMRKGSSSVTTWKLWSGSVMTWHVGSSHLWGDPRHWTFPNQRLLWKPGSGSKISANSDKMQI